MIISKKAIADYLDKPLRDLTFVKSWDRATLEAKWAEWKPDKRPQLHRDSVDLWLHQWQCLYLLLRLKALLLFADVGLGKTRLCLEAFRVRKRLGKAKQMLVLALNDANVEGWLENVKEHCPDVKAVGLIGSSEEKWKLRQEPVDAYIVSYPGLRAMLAKGGDEKHKPDVRLLREFMGDITFVVYDEIHKCKRWSSITYQLCNKISAQCEYRYGCTGTPFGRDPQDLWTQFFLIDRGETFGKTLSMFRAAFFNTAPAWHGGLKHTFIKKMKGKLREMMRNRSIVYEDREAGGMPVRRRIAMPLRAPKTVQEYYNQALKELRASRAAGKIESNFIRLRMIASGFLAVRVDSGEEDEEKIEIEFEDNPKLAALETFIENLPIGRKAIIVHEFVYSGKIIDRHLEHLGVRYTKCEGSRSGGKSFQLEQLSKFKKDPHVRVLRMNWKAGGTGLDFPNANYMFFYESPVSPIDRRQCEGRVRRRNSKYKRTYYTDAYVKGSVEERILEYLKEGQDLRRALLRHRVEI